MICWSYLRLCSTDVMIMTNFTDYHSRVIPLIVLAAPFFSFHVLFNPSLQSISSFTISTK